METLRLRRRSPVAYPITEETSNARTVMNGTSLPGRVWAKARAVAHRQFRR